ncbi:hypothetical protein HAX54_011881 [Datura stramonium]|uniref:Uncharacterized protein n=1 Tax=Datura stramonium TaxID=4076 RepID=A0ABS8TLN3_DATST|nr:hypothetical protein [Datura stramonium]
MLLFGVLANAARKTTSDTIISYSVKEEEVSSTSQTVGKSERSPPRRSRTKGLGGGNGGILRTFIKWVFCFPLWLQLGFQFKVSRTSYSRLRRKVNNLKQ